MKILSINPGSTSTKIALYEDLVAVFEKTLRHSTEETEQYAKITDQFKFRKDLIVEFLAENGVNIADLDAIMGRGGLLKPIPGGIYAVNDAMLADLTAGINGEHASNLGGIIAYEISKESGRNIPAFIADPVVVDELCDLARVSGHPLLPKVSIFHALNQKAIARRYAKDVSKNYNELTLIVVHLGGGISVGLHKDGKIIDVNNALNGNGPFSPERAGTLPSAALVKLCFSGKYSENEVLKMVTGKGGAVAFVGSNDMYEIEQRAEKGDTKCQKVVDALSYQVAKEIGYVAPVANGKIDAILITGGIARSKPICEEITRRVEFIAPVKIYPGEDEMGALNENAYYAIKGQRPILEYK